MYEELVKRLRNCTSDTVEDCAGCLYQGGYKGTYCMNGLIEESADAIEEQDMCYRHLERDYKSLCAYLPRWIPVTERLPEKEKRTYWICTDMGYQCECRWTNNYFGIGESDGWGWCIVDVPQYHKVMAWMFLPKPYKPPKEET